MLKVADDDDGAFAGKLECCGEPDALCGAGDQGNFAFEAMGWIHGGLLKSQPASVASRRIALLRRIRGVSSRPQTVVQLFAVTLIRTGLQAIF
ncbi:hypothetical protein [Casimicrobium huifangae]|uniref:hypothetical protein n=1 Tax=Casimicrobium huifangae TaxID=2591109 RepID=UPI0037832C7C